MQLAHGTPVRSRFQPSPVTRGTGDFACPRLPEAARLHRGAPLRRAARPVHAPDSTEPPIGQPGPFAYACDASELPAPSRGVHRQSHSRGPSPLRHPSSPEAPFLDGHYPASSVLRASPPPCRPGLPLAGVPVAACTAPAWLPVLPRLPSSTCADATTPAKTGRCSRRSLPGQSAAFPFLAQGRLPR